jgi:hypothetical protein
MKGKAKKNLANVPNLDWAFNLFWFTYFAVEVGIIYAVAPLTKGEAFLIFICVLTLSLIWFNRADEYSREVSYQLE